MARSPPEARQYCNDNLDRGKDALTLILPVSRKTGWTFKVFFAFVTLSLSFGDRKRTTKQARQSVECTLSVIREESPSRNEVCCLWPNCSIFSLTGLAGMRDRLLMFHPSGFLTFAAPSSRPGRGSGRALPHHSKVSAAIIEANCSVLRS